MKGLLAICITFSLLTGAAMSQTLTPGTDQASPIESTIGSAGATLSLDDGQGKIIAKCAAADRDCIFQMPGLSLGKPYATTSIKCGNTIYQVSTNGGSCEMTYAPGGKGPPTGASCSTADNQNSSEANCDGGCGPSSGSGSCTITAK